MALLPQDPQKQKLVLIGILPLLIAGLYYQFYHTGRAEQVTEIEQHVEQLESKNAAMRQIVARYGPGFEQRLAVLEEHVRQLEQLIPRREHVPMLISQITQQAQNIGVELAALNPGPEEAAEIYSKQTYELQVLGDYHSIGEYLTSIGSLPRIVKSTELKLGVAQQATRPGASPRLRAVFRIQTYVVPDAGPTGDTATASANANG